LSFNGPLEEVLENTPSWNDIKTWLTVRSYIKRLLRVKICFDVVSSINVLQNLIEYLLKNPRPLYDKLFVTESLTKYFSTY